MSKEISEQYTITTDELITNVRLPSIITRFVIMLAAVAMNVILVYYLLTTRYTFSAIMGYEPILSTLIAFFLFGLGLLGGKLWTAFGYRISTATYRIYLRDEGGKFFKLFAFIYVKLSDPDSKIYLEARANDPNLRHPINLFKLIFTISLSQISFFVVATGFLSRPMIELLRSILSEKFFLFSDVSGVLLVQNISSMGIAVAAMALYIPMNFIMNDSNIRTWNTDLTVGTPSSKIRARIDGLIGISALATGWGIYASETNNGLNRTLIDINLIVQGYDFGIVIDYALWIGTLLVMSWPLIVPASIYYFTNHQKTVNKFRQEANFRGVPIGATNVRLPKDDEDENIKLFQEYNNQTKENK